jgi:hypothetical protein
MNSLATSVQPATHCLLAYRKFGRTTPLSRSRIQHRHLPSLKNKRNNYELIHIHATANQRDSSAR